MSMSSSQKSLGQKNFCSNVSEYCYVSIYAIKIIAFHKKHTILETWRVWNNFWTDRIQFAPLNKNHHLYVLLPKAVSLEIGSIWYFSSIQTFIEKTYFQTDKRFCRQCPPSASYTKLLFYSLSIKNSYSSKEQYSAVMEVLCFFL